MTTSNSTSQEIAGAQMIFLCDGNDNDNHKYIFIPSTALGRHFPTDGLIFRAHNNLASAILSRF